MKLLLTFLLIFGTVGIAKGSDSKPNDLFEITNKIFKTINTTSGLRGIRYSKRDRTFIISGYQIVEDKRNMIRGRALDPRELERSIPCANVYSRSKKAPFSYTKIEHKIRLKDKYAIMANFNSNKVQNCGEAQGPINKEVHFDYIQIMGVLTTLMAKNQLEFVHLKFNSDSFEIKGYLKNNRRCKFLIPRKRNAKKLLKIPKSVCGIALF